MDLKSDFLLGFEAIKLNRKAIKDIIAKKDNAWSITLLISITATIVTIIGSLLYRANPAMYASDEFSMMLYSNFAIATLIGTFIFAPISFIIGSSIIHLGAKIFRGKGKGMDMYKGLGAIYPLNILTVIPFLNILVYIWQIVVYVVAISEIHQFSKVKAFFSLFILGVIILALFMFLILPMMILDPTAWTPQ